MFKIDDSAPLPKDIRSRGLTQEMRETMGALRRGESFEVSFLTHKPHSVLTTFSRLKKEFKDAFTIRKTEDHARIWKV